MATRSPAAASQQAAPGLDLGKEAHELAAELVVPQPSRVGLQRMAIERLDLVALPLRALEGDHAALRGECRLRDPPAVVLAPDHVLGGIAHIGEEELAELGPAVRLPDRPHLDAGRLHIHDEVGDAAVLRRARDRCG